MNYGSSTAMPLAAIWAFILALTGVIVLTEASPPEPLVRPQGRAEPDDGDMCKKLEIPCVHGSCVNSTNPHCDCQQGWKGAACDTCGGRMMLTNKTGFITDGYKNYTTDTKCTWLIEAPSVDQIIRLQFIHFATECSWDHLYIYNGSSVHSPQLASYSGLVIPNGTTTSVMPEVTMTGFSMLHFYSDAAYNMSGFNISYTMEPQSCPLGCSQHGECLADSQCKCDSAWIGDGCQYDRCPKNCSYPNGSCGPEGCSCINSHGIDCNIPESGAYWEYVETQSPPSRRASHKHIREDEYLYVFFGYDFNNNPTDTVTRLNLDTLKWETKVATKLQIDSQHPSPRYGHSVALHQPERKVYMFGGLLLDTNTITSELWEYSLNQNTWSKVDFTEHPLPVVGHTAHIIANLMYVFFGHNPTFGYLNNIQIYNMTDKKWKVTYGQGTLVKGGYGHSSVYDSVNNVIYVHGGYVSTTSSTYTLSDSLYIFDPATKLWSVRTGSGHPKFLHSAVLLDGMMYVFGGNTHNDTNISQGAKCYSTNFYAYDPICDKWFSLDPPHLRTDISRFGHIAEAYKDHMYIFGGFNGQVLNDLYKFSPESCDLYGDRISCLYNKAGVPCAWSEKKHCLSVADAAQIVRQKRIEDPEVRSCEPPTIETARAVCGSLNLCSTCVDSRYGCVWCDKTCLHKDEQVPERCTNKPEANDYNECQALYPSVATLCTTIHNCMACKKEDQCQWLDESICVARQSNEEPEDVTVCNKPCHLYNTCGNCTDSKCMWCGNQRRCVESISYVASFPYGQCMEWTTQRDKCPYTYCAGLRTCEDCHQSPACGWCDDGSDTGLGQCMEGGLSSPITNSRASTAATCVADRWYFKHCPACQCNGHSQCDNETSVCTKCEDNTTGDQCETCKDGYYGTATSGGNCSACDCNGQADTCHPETGKCYCHTRGVKGDRCDTCDEQNKYFGDPKNGGTCYYDLNTNYKFTFNLSEDKEGSKYQTHINFRNEPPEPERDVDFTINCSGKAMMNITFTSSVNDNEEEVFLHVNKPCTIFEEKFSHNEYTFGGDSNTTFYVYVFDFTTPFIVEISFLQIDPIDLIHFFITFFSCFLSLLLIAAVVWKVKQKCDLYRRRQRMVVEMEQMASRPFSVCNIDLPSTVEEPLLRQEYITNMANTRGSQRFKKAAQNGYSPSPITLEPMSGNKAAVLSLLIRLPSGDEEYAPPGQQGMAVGSAVVTIGNHRKLSTDVQRPDKNIKPRKPMGDIPENCV